MESRDRKNTLLLLIDYKDKKIKSLKDEVSRLKAENRELLTKTK